MGISLYIQAVMAENTLGIIGGTGLYQLDTLENIQEHEVETPFGTPSAPIVEGSIGRQRVLFLPRHGRRHEFLPHEVNYRANIWALKKLEARSILSVSATGSLQEKYEPGDLALVSQYFDHTRGKRTYSFFGEGITGHITAAQPSCPSLTKNLEEVSKSLELEVHKNVTYACVEGPRLGTQAESLFLKNAVKADLVGMTNIPEVFLAREAQIGYLTLAIVTDYDCWMENEEKHADIEEIFRIYGETIDKVKNVIEALAKQGVSKPPEWIRKTLTNAIMTPDEQISEEQKKWLDVLRA